MSKKQLIIFIIIAFFVGAAGSIFFNRLLLPYLSGLPKLSWLKNLQSTSPITVISREEIQLNEGANFINLAKQASAFTVSIYVGSPNNLHFASSGIILSSDGLIFTTREVVGNASQVTVVLNDGSNYQGLVRALDPKSDLAVITVPVSKLLAAPLADATQLQPGQRLLAVGKGEREFSHMLAVGFVTRAVLDNASLDKVNSSENFEESLSTDMELTGDFVGGPVINLDGNVVGTVVSSGKILITEAIRGALTSYLAAGKIVRPSFGIKYQVISKPLASLKNLPAPGVLVVAVSPASPAAKAGLALGDLITDVDGQSLQDNSLEQILNGHAISDMKVSLIRNGNKIDLTVKLEAE